MALEFSASARNCALRSRCKLGQGSEIGYGHARPKSGKTKTIRGGWLSPPHAQRPAVESDQNLQRMEGQHGPQDCCAAETNRLHGPTSLTGGGLVIKVSA